MYTENAGGTALIKWFKKLREQIKDRPGRFPKPRIVLQGTQVRGVGYVILNWFHIQLDAGFKTALAP